MYPFECPFFRLFESFSDVSKDGVQDVPCDGLLQVEPHLAHSYMQKASSGLKKTDSLPYWDCLHNFLSEELRDVTMSTRTQNPGLFKKLIFSLLAFSATAVQAATVVYVANSESKDISVFSLNRDGQLIALQTMPVGGTVMPMAISADKAMLYAALRSKPYSVVALRIDPKSGQLSEHGSAPLPESMANISLDRSGKFLFAASYGGNQVSVSPLDENRVPLAATQILPTPPMAHQITAQADNKIVYASSLGGDQLLSFSFDPVKGSLTPGSEPALSLPAKSGPRHFVFSKDNRFIYLLDELDGRLHVLQRASTTPQLKLLQTTSVIPAQFAGTPAAADLHLTPDGRFLYASERGSNTLSGFRVDARTGELSLIGSWPTETQPRGFNLSPDGNFLLAVGQKSHQLSAYRIDPQSGQLTLLAQYATGKNPNWVEVIELP